MVIVELSTCLIQPGRDGCPLPLISAIAVDFACSDIVHCSQCQSVLGPERRDSCATLGYPRAWLIVFPVANASTKSFLRQTFVLMLDIRNILKPVSINQTTTLLPLRKIVEILHSLRTCEKR